MKQTTVPSTPRDQDNKTEQRHFWSINFFGFGASQQFLFQHITKWEKCVPASLINSCIRILCKQKFIYCTWTDLPLRNCDICQKICLQHWPHIAFCQRFATRSTLPPAILGFAFFNGCRDPMRHAVSSRLFENAQYHEHQTWTRCSCIEHGLRKTMKQTQNMFINESVSIFDWHYIMEKHKITVPGRRTCHQDLAKNNANIATVAHEPLVLGKVQPLNKVDKMDARVNPLFFWFLLFEKIGDLRMTLLPDCSATLHFKRCNNHF